MKEVVMKNETFWNIMKVAGTVIILVVIFATLLGVWGIYKKLYKEEAVVSRQPATTSGCCGASSVPVVKAPKPLLVLTPPSKKVELCVVEPQKKKKKPLIAAVTPPSKPRAATTPPSRILPSIPTAIVASEPLPLAIVAGESISTAVVGGGFRAGSDAQPTAKIKPTKQSSGILDDVEVGQGKAVIIPQNDRVVVRVIQSPYHDYNDDRYVRVQRHHRH